NQLTDSQRKKIMDDGRAEFDRFAQIQNPTAIQKEQYLAKLQMKGCDVSDEKGALTGNIKALEGTAWERTFNMILGFVRYFGSAITLVKEKFSGKKTDTTDKPSDQPEAPDAKNQRVGTELLQKNGAKIVNGIHAFSDDKGILENDNFPIYKFENGKWMARLEKGNDPWKETGQMKFTGPENLAGTLEPVFKKWEDVTKGLADANGEAEKAKATQKPAGEAPEKKLMNDEVIAASKINEEKTAAIFKNVLESGGKDGWVRITIDGKQDRFEYKIGLEEDQPSLQRQLPNVERSKWQYNAADKRWKPLA
ncbi:hypothetical protein HYZ99_03670, partial [Candidatus Peregrinibacteria bacterium]|nr:hypothetical protein [Candidatus Peregrinibacteria bacterium]